MKYEKSLLNITIIVISLTIIILSHNKSRSISNLTIKSFISNSCINKHLHSCPTDQTICMNESSFTSSQTGFDEILLHPSKQTFSPQIIRKSFCKFIETNHIQYINHRLMVLRI